jgi:hypothetical protein
MTVGTQCVVDVKIQFIQINGFNVDKSFQGSFCSLPINLLKLAHVYTCFFVSISGLILTRLLAR